MNKSTGNRDGKIEEPFDEAVQRAFQRLFAQADEANAVVFENNGLVVEIGLKIVEHDQPDRGIFAELGDFAEPFAAKR